MRRSRTQAEHPRSTAGKVSPCEGGGLTATAAIGEPESQAGPRFRLLTLEERDGGVRRNRGWVRLRSDGGGKPACGGREEGSDARAGHLVADPGAPRRSA